MVRERKQKSGRMVIECFNGMARWLGSTEGLYTFLSMCYVMGILTGFGLVKFLPKKIAHLLGL